MRSRLHCVLLASLGLATCSALAQMHKVARPEQVVRAVGVYEYTGDLSKPAASRLIPVSLYIDGKLQDAGIYIARPVPFALLSGNVYELESAGTPKALLDLVYARHLQATEATGELAYDDGWFGYGKVQPLAIPRRSALKASKTVPALKSSVKDTASSADPDRPVMIRRNGTNTSSSNSSNPATNPPADDPDRPTIKRRDSPSSSGTNSSTAGGDAPPEDPDRPAMKRTPPSSGSPGSSTSGTASTNAPAAGSTADSTSSPADSADSGSTKASTGDPANDPDRPTLKRRTPEEARKARNANAGASATGYDSLNDDPNRPNLHHGKPTQALTETELPKLTGLPQNLHQMVAVSDAVDRTPHSFTLAWEDAGQRAAILEKMQTLARAQLAAYGKPAVSAAAGKPASSTKSAAGKAAHTTSSRSTTHHAAKSASLPLVPLQDEDLQAYLLSYGGDPTYVYSAHTDGAGAALRYVTIVAQSDSLGQFKPAIENVTDAAHLDDKPRMRLIDAVDAEASNRASLLFELRGQTARQFALYRVIAGHSDQIFLTGTTQ